MNKRQIIIIGGLTVIVTAIATGFYLFYIQRPQPFRIDEMPTNIQQQEVVETIVPFCDEIADSTEIVTCKTRNGEQNVNSNINVDAHTSANQYTNIEEPETP